MALEYGTLAYARKGDPVQRLALRPGTLTIGSAALSDLLIDDPAVAHAHARLLVSEDGCWVTDLGSPGGTFLNQVRLQPQLRHPLRDGDMLRVGPLFVRYGLDRQPAPVAQLAPAPGAPGASAGVPALPGLLPEVAARASGPRPPQPLGQPPANGNGNGKHANARRLNGNAGQSYARAALERGRLPQGASSYLAYLPPPYQEAEFIGRFLMIFESILGPIEGTIDQIAHYFDPRLAPEPLLRWLASWLGVALDEHLSLRQQRELVKSAALLYRWRGTRRGLSEYLRICTGAEPLIVEPGDRIAGAELPPFVFAVILDVPDPDQVDRTLIERIIDAQKPAHTSYVLEIRRMPAG